ncbi:MAG TPA: hypothetical protein VET45_17580 [Candidatus Binatia bacterium]|nr:hypothetical protein [Candidatus Binatia bacterium]
MRRLAAVLALGLVGYPLVIAPSTAVLTLGAVATALCALGILFSTPVLVVGTVLALGEYTLALWLRAGPPRLAGAVLFGVGLVLLLETADFGGRTRQAAIGPRVVSSQIRYWAVFGVLASAAALIAISAASTLSASVRLPWAPGFAAAGAAVALAAVAVALGRPRTND